MRTLACLVSLALVGTAAANPKIDAVMKPWARTDGPGCAVAVIERGAITHAKGYGMADLERRVPITPDTVFDIGSVSKQLTAATILLLAAQGALSLDDDIRKHLPELPALGKTPTTIRHLVHHTGGLRDYMTLLVLGGTRIADVATSPQTLSILARQRGRDFEPGAKFEYSNTGYFLLAQIAERVTKQPMRELVAQKIFAPLGMAASLVLDDHRRVVPNRALGYGRTARGDGWALDLSQWEQTGDGAVLTTVKDLAKWDASFYTARVGGKALVDGLLARGTLADGTPLDYAAGLFHGTYRGQPTVWHSGGWAGFRAQLLRFPQQRTSVIVLCNAASSDPRKLADAIADVVLAGKLGPAEPAAAPPAKAATLTTAELDAWAGVYRDTKGGVSVVRRADDRLEVVSGSEVLPLVVTGARTATLRDVPISIELLGAAPRRALRVRIRGIDERSEEVVPVPAQAVDGLAGRYFSPELGATWVVELRGTQLVARGPGMVDAPVLAVSKDLLLIPSTGLSLEVARKGGRITGFSLRTTGIATGIAFER